MTFSPRGICLIAAYTVFLLLLLSVPGYGFETTARGMRFELTGSINVRADANRVRKRVRASVNNMARLYNVLVVNGKASTERHLIVTQLRPHMTSRFDPASDHYSRVSVDELYWDARVTDTITTTVGRRRLVNGVALGYNPTDFLSHDKQMTGSNLTDIERRSERKGDNLVGFSKFFESATLQGYLLFPNSFTGSEDLRGLVQFAHRLQSLQTDYTLSAYYDDRLQLGLNVAATLSHSITGYLEVAVSEDRGRRVVRDGFSNLRPPGYASPSQPGYPGEIDYAAMRKSAVRWEKNSNPLKLEYYDAVIGFQYTSPSGIGVNAEYWRSNTAYTQREFNDIWDAVEVGRLSPSDAEDILSANNNVQRDKLFLRISDIPLIGDELSLEQTNIYGINDQSFFSRTSFSWQATEASTLRLNLNYFAGDKRSEFGMLPYEWQVYTSFKHLF